MGRHAPRPMTNIRHLYLHVPFCRRHCPYCDYPVFVERRPDLGGWIEGVGRELRLREAQGISLDSIETLLVGGGTPSIFGAALAGRIRSLLGPERLAQTREWTVESNPEDLSSDVLQAWRDEGVTRLNIAVQSLDDSALRWLGRLHSASSARSALECAAGSGIPSWGVDLLFGLPMEVEADPTTGLDEVMAAGVPHVSLYELIPEPRTPLGESVESGDVRLADEDTRADQYLALCERLAASGYEAYEMTAFARPGHRSRHTTAVMEDRFWLGLGPGAHSHFPGRRSWNLRDWPGYSTAVAKMRLPEAGSGAVAPDLPTAERFWFRLRQSAGLPRAELSIRGRQLVDGWARAGLATKDPDRVRLTPSGWLRLDELSTALARTEAGVERAIPDAGTVDP